MDLNKLFKPVQSMPKVAADVDPKSVLCAFFKAGLCGKGNKCKYSHDMSVVNKSAKRNLYVDSRDVNKGKRFLNSFFSFLFFSTFLFWPRLNFIIFSEEETNENWDKDQLAEVAEKKHGEADKKRPNQTDIVCKYFIDAVENNKYGWFWECENGAKCKVL